ncbi:unnamed protein product, partial [Prorocentrum cordatum]
EADEADQPLLEELRAEIRSCHFRARDRQVGRTSGKCPHANDEEDDSSVVGRLFEVAASQERRHVPAAPSLCRFR